MNIEADKLLASVHARSALHEYRLADHHNNVIDKLWEDVGKELNATGADCNRKWEALRMSYRNYMRDFLYTRNESGALIRNHLYTRNQSGELVRTEYNLDEALSFRQYVLDQNMRTANTSDDTPTDNQDTANSLRSSSSLENEIENIMSTLNLEE